ncbi:thioredoxin [Hazenella coriacea]|uniref:Thioredoxin n=1 Tax=Hazenella coriacea TaxID=1179467 RepID=A0A4R3L515_9BACL|nr:thioredoxin [Hazenella coriacea]TCS94881.1 thioredoxin [Hazenella coriacea]
MAIIQLNDQEFQSTIETGKLILVDFTANWCQPCRLLAPILEDLEGQMGEQVMIAKVDVDESPESAQKCGVMSIPTLKLYKDGKEVGTKHGVQKIDALKEWISKYS